MQGRGARRYLPPGPINNYNLVMALQRENGIPPPEQQKPNMTRIDKNALQNQKLQKLLQPQQQQQQNLPPGGHKNVRRFILGEDYHVVNFNVWQYWSMVYGGVSLSPAYY